MSEPVNRRAFLAASATAAFTPAMAHAALAKRPTTATSAVPAIRPILGDASSADEWSVRRTSLVEAMRKYLGSPSPFEKPSPNVRVLSETGEGDYLRQKIAYDVEPGEEVRAWLLIPPVEKRSARKNAAVLCLHGTSSAAKDTQVFDDAKPGRDFGRFLARHGFVTLSPDHCCSGERSPSGIKPYDSKPFYDRHPNWSMVGKTIYDGQCAIDVLSQVDGVDASRIGSIGHSLGGHGSMFLSAFDERVKVAVNSCGMTYWTGNPERRHWARDAWYIYFKPLQGILSKPETPVPFEFYDFAGLIAPRSFLTISGMSDTMYGPTAAFPEIGRQIQRVYDVVGASANFAQFLLGAGHDVPPASRALALAWIDSALHI